MCKMSKKDLEISEALNSLTTANLRGAVGDVTLIELISDYFCSGDQSDASSDSDSNSDEDGDVDSTDTVADDREPAADDDCPVVMVDVASSVLSDTGATSAGEAVSEGEDQELERVRSFVCGCNKPCYVQLSHDFVLKRRLDMKELTEGNLN